MGLFDKDSKKDGESEPEDLFGRPLPSGTQQPTQQSAVRSQESGTAASQMMDQLGNLTRRLKILEERASNMSKRLQLTDHNLIEGTKKLHSEIRTHTDELQDIRKQLREMEDKISLIIKEFRNVPRKEDMKILEKYVELWNPMDFVTRKQAKRIIGELLDKREAERPEEGE